MGRSQVDLNSIRSSCGVVYVTVSTRSRKSSRTRRGKMERRYTWSNGRGIATRNALGNRPSISSQRPLMRTTEHAKRLRQMRRTHHRRTTMSTYSPPSVWPRFHVDPTNRASRLKCWTLRIQPHMGRRADLDWEDNRATQSYRLWGPWTRTTPYAQQRWMTRSSKSVLHGHGQYTLAVSKWNG